MDIELTLGSERLMLRQVPFTVLEGEMEDIIIGYDVVRILGLDFFAMFKQKIKDVNYEYVFDFLLKLSQRGEDSSVPKCTSKLETSWSPLGSFHMNHNSTQHHLGELEGSKETKGNIQNNYGKLEGSTTRRMSNRAFDPFWPEGRKLSSRLRPDGQNKAILQGSQRTCRSSILESTTNFSKSLDERDALNPLLREALDSMIDRVAKNVSENETHVIDLFRELVYKFADIEDDDSGPARVTPLHIHLKTDAKPKRARMRRYNAIEQRFLESMTRKLLKNGSIYRNRRSRWSCPSYVVKKPGRSGESSDDYRWTIDLRYVNSQCDPIAGSMPILDNLLLHLQGSCVYASLDAHKGYWQFPLSKKSQEACSFLTHEGVFSPTRLLQGHQDSVVAFQNGMEEVLGELIRVVVLCWIDDLLVHARSTDELINGLEKVFEKIRKFNIKLNPEKSNLLVRRVSWCGKVIDVDGVSFDPEMIRGLRDMQLPSTAAQLQQLLCGSNWLRISLPGYAAVVSTLQEMLKRAMKEVGSSKSLKLRSVVLKWTESEREAFEKLRNLLSESVKLAHFRQSEDWSLNLYTDASDRHWGVVLTQCPVSDLKKKILDQKHEPLAFLSGSFSGAQLNWSTIEREAYPIMESLDRLRHYLSLKMFKLFTDHRNLKYIFTECSQDADVKKQVADKLKRWHIRLQAFNYSVEHIAGVNNFWANLLSRWKSIPSRLCSISLGERGKMDLDPQTMDSSRVNQISTPNGEEHHMDEYELLVAAVDGVNQMDYTEILAKMNHLQKTDTGLLIVEADEMKAKLITLAHCGLSGHRGIGHTLQRLQSWFYWEEMKSHVTTFVTRCLHCLACRTQKIKCLLAEQIHASEPNMVLHYDFLYVFKKYVLVVKDDFSHFVELTVCDAANHLAVVDAVLWWNARHGLRRGSVHISYQGTHFKNQVCRELERIFGVQHRFTLAHTPYSIGTVEVVNKHILRILRTLRSEFKMNDWESLVPLVQTCLNINCSTSLGNLSPLQIFSGHKVDDPVSVLFDRSGGILHKRIDSEHIMQLTKGMRTSLEEMHRVVSTHKGKRRESRRNSRNKGRGLPNYAVGDFVLVFIPSPRDKCSARFDGPYRVISTVSEHAYVVEHLLSSVRKTVHVERLLFYSSKDVSFLKRLKEHVLFHKADAYEVENLLDRRSRNGVEEVLVKWLGFEDCEATWEPLSIIEEDLPDLVSRLMEKGKPGDQAGGR